MTDLEFLTFIRECTLSNEIIAYYYGISPNVVRGWRQGKHVEAKKIESVFRELTMLEQDELSKQIQNYVDKRKT